MKGKKIRYSDDELAWIKRHARNHRASAHSAFVAKFARPDVSLKNFHSLCKRKGWFTGLTGRFEAGQPAHNKGKTLSPEARAKSARTMFKTGHVPHNYRGPGHEFLDPKDGYIFLIISDETARTKTKTRRVLKHKWLWEQKNGPLPKGHALKCLDGNRQNTDPENWQAVPRACLPRLAGGRWGRIPYDKASPEVRPVLLTIAKLEHAAREATP